MNIFLERIFYSNTYSAVKFTTFFTNFINKYSLDFQYDLIQLRSTFHACVEELFCKKIAGNYL